MITFSEQGERILRLLGSKSLLGTMSALHMYDLQLRTALASR